MIESLKHMDTALFLWLNGKHTVFFDFVMYWATGKYIWVPFYVLLLYFVRRKFHNRTLLVIALVSVLILLSDQISVQCFKETFQRYRPCHNLLIQNQVHLITGCGGEYGFVSSHAANTFATALFLSLLFKKRNVTLLLFLWAAFVSYTRIYAGVHYPADVLCGALVGMAIACLMAQLFYYLEDKFFRQ